MSVKMDFEIPSNCRENCKKSQGGDTFLSHPVAQQSRT